MKAKQNKVLDSRGSQFTVPNKCPYCNSTRKFNMIINGKRLQKCGKCDHAF